MPGPLPYERCGVEIDKAHLEHAGGKEGELIFAMVG